MKRWSIPEPLHTAERLLSEPASWLREGRLVAFPTETVYGLGANALSEPAIKQIFQVKGRPSDNPLIVHIPSKDELHWVCDPGFTPNRATERAMEAFWPGPLTILVPAGKALAPSVHPGLDTVGVRVPSHPLAQELIRQAGVPIAAPSANKSGRPSPTTADDVNRDLAHEPVGLVDGGPCDVGYESTVVRIDDDKAVIYRPGGITREQLEEMLGIAVHLDAHLEHPEAKPASPGMKYRHYAPEARVTTWWGEPSYVARAMAAYIAELSCDVQTEVGVMAPRSVLRTMPEGVAQAVWSPDAEVGELYARLLGRDLYHELRQMDARGVKEILVCGVNPGEGVGLAVMNRLQKASEGRVFHVTD